jgi:serine protease inhibitor
MYPFLPEREQGKKLNLFRETTRFSPKRQRALIKLPIEAAEKVRKKMKKSSILLMVFIFLGAGSVHQGEGQEIRTSEVKSDLRHLVEGNNEFAFDLYARLAKKEGNIVFSPYSISTALGMTYAGARGKTAEEMAKVLHFSLGQERLHPAFGGLIADLQKDDKTRAFQLHVANALWGQQGYPFLERFLRLVKRPLPRGSPRIGLR